MIHVYGTSHVSGESFEVIDEALEEHDPEVVALELDYPRLNSLLGEEESSGGPLFARLINMLQNRIGASTGVMPGDEMKYAYRKAVDQEREIALVDQDIRITIQRLRDIRRKEKVKAVFSMLFSLVKGGEFDVSSIPDEEVIENLVKDLEEEFPGLYRVLMEERNRYIVEALKNVERENEGDIVAFLGAAHVKEVRRMLDEVDSEGAVAEVQG